ncbi:hypothetical protein ACHAWF_001567, partial [Thalassiosira exigua]
AVVTGSNTGVGYETALGLAERGHRVILACRSWAKGEAAAERINGRLKSSGGRGSRREARALRLDLSSFASVRKFCQAFEVEHDAHNVLVNNAGTNAQGDVTEDGLESCFQSNTAGHFLLTKLLLDRLLKAKNAYPAGSDRGNEAGRVVNLSSVTHHFAPANERALAVHADDPDGDAPAPSERNPRRPLLAGMRDAGRVVGHVPRVEVGVDSVRDGIEQAVRISGRSVGICWRDELDLAKRLYEKVYLTT